MYGKVLFLSLTLVPKIHFFRLLPKKQRISVYIHIYIYIFIHMYKCSGIFLDTVRKKKAVEAAMNPGGRIKAFAA